MLVAAAVIIDYEKNGEDCEDIFTGKTWSLARAGLSDRAIILKSRLGFVDENGEFWRLRDAPSIACECGQISEEYRDYLVDNDMALLPSDLWEI